MNIFSSTEPHNGTQNTFSSSFFPGNRGLRTGNSPDFAHEPTPPRYRPTGCATCAGRNEYTKSKESEQTASLNKLIKKEDFLAKLHSSSSEDRIRTDPDSSIHVAKKGGPTESYTPFARTLKTGFN